MNPRAPGPPWRGPGPAGVHGDPEVAAVVGPPVELVQRVLASWSAKAGAAEVLG